jgi:hypothetical protein
MVIPKGTLTPQSRLIELKSNAKRSGRPYEQMWFGRTPIAIPARHIDGQYFENNLHINYMD